MILHNVTRKTVLAKEPRRARAFFTRMRGMIGRSFSDEFDALIFEHCNAVHSLFMSQPIDVLFLSGDNRIVHQRTAFPPWRFCEGFRAAVLTIELPAGTLARTGTQTGDYIDLDVELLPELNARPSGLAGAAPAPTNLFGDKS